jgi:3-dehydroquinate synthase
MSKNLKSIKGSNYEVTFSENGNVALNNLLESKSYSTIFILVDNHTKDFCLPYFLEHFEDLKGIPVIEIPANEINKHLDTCRIVWQKLSDMGADRKSLLINLGGGVVTDLGGFVASTFKRGIDFVNIPTTLLSMVDASVGGKTGVDLGGLKNQIGVIVNPQLVIVDSEFLKTLPKNEYKSGYSEMLKHGLICDASYFRELSQFKGLEDENILPYIHHSVMIKNEVITEDPYEMGRRKILNFGHTLGHAIESFFLTDSNKTALLHGEAIAVGMILEAYLATQLCELSSSEADEIKSVFLNLFPKVNFSKEDIQEILTLLKYDKKNSHGKVKFVLLNKIGIPLIDIQIEDFYFEGAFNYYQKD